MPEASELAQLIVSSRVRRQEGADRPDRDPALTIIRRGFYRPATAVVSAADGHHLQIASTVEARGPGLVFSHASAALLWGAPLLHRDLAVVQACQPGRPRRTTANVRIHPGALPAEHVVTLPSGLVATSREWTAMSSSTLWSAPFLRGCGAGAGPSEIFAWQTRDPAPLVSRSAGAR
jgi:hypothetical protein